LTGQDVAFLLIGMLVGVGVGAAVASAVRARSAPRPAVRVTVAPNAIPRKRAATLAHNGVTGPLEPARGGPADPSPALSADRPEPPKVRTPVRPMLGPALVFATAPATGGGSARLVPVPMGSFRGRQDPRLAFLPGGAAVAGTAVLDRTAPAATAAANDATPSGEGAAADEVIVETAVPPIEQAAPSGPCGELRTVADERCEVASRARVEAERAHDTLRAAQRSYDDHLSRAEEAAHAADPRTIRAAKDAAQQTFRAARGGAGGPEAVDAAARDWLLEINRINQDARAAAAASARDQEAARNLAGSLDRLTVEADAARIAADAADEACLAAREAAADCDEALEAAPASMPAMPSGAPAGMWVDDPAIGDEPATALAAGTAPTIFRLLEGDRVSLLAVVERLAGDLPDQRRAWQLAISDLVDAILATAIEGSALEFPEDHPFWGPFTLMQARDIVAGLSSLGYRFDGLGGWQDGRIPSQRDLSLALGYAGIDPMRMRHWPNEAEMAELFRDVRVAAAEYLAQAAGDLTLGELVTMLGHRADGLTDVWNAWGRVRPLLLEER
jgi:hypothetical protein